MVALAVPVKEAEGEELTEPPPAPSEGEEAGVEVGEADTLTEAVAVPVEVAQGVPVTTAVGEFAAVEETVSEPPPAAPPAPHPCPEALCE